MAFCNKRRGLGSATIRQQLETLFQSKIVNFLTLQTDGGSAHAVLSSLPHPHFVQRTLRVQFKVVSSDARAFNQVFVPQFLQVFPYPLVFHGDSDRLGVRAIVDGWIA
jgi:hypothetical protein